MEGMKLEIRASMSKIGHFHLCYLSILTTKTLLLLPVSFSMVVFSQS